MAKILLVEDDNNLREIFELRLQADGYDTVVASNGEEALVIALREKPDLIIADVMMPKMSGFEMLENLRAAPEMSKVKVVMMTALGQAEDRARGESLGVVKYLVKSQVTLEDFARVIKEVMGQSGSTPSEQSLEAKATNPPTSEPKEGDKKMPNTPAQTATNQASVDTSASNPISGTDIPAPADNSQMTTSDAKSAFDSQVNDFASSMGSPGSGSGITGDIPVATPPDEPNPPTEPKPTTPPPSPDAPTIT